ncbi:hypothetical protein [Rhizosaccharibacter radicis]|uniref:Methyltransferase n=1 Tax=Rhizosaccharibacter radicis TaxID=2782605 RepID=A0ABT1VW33_9PROT|nr:hypothetical protein [Acetobacteraceae bacterium KSS12]
MRASGYERAAADWYVEPRWCVDAMLDAEPPFSGLVWDPFAGSGTIPGRLRARGIPAIASDLHDRGCGVSGSDFFTTRTAASSIVANPPYGRAREVVDRGLSMTTDRVCLLLRLAFLEGQGRRAWFPTSPLARVWVSSRRISMPPGDSDIPATGGAIAYAWFVWAHGHCGKPQIGWI